MRLVERNNAEYNVWLLRCDNQKTDTNFAFQFGAAPGPTKTIIVPISAVVLPFFFPNGEVYTEGGYEYCQTGFVSSKSDNLILLGDALSAFSICCI